MLVRSTVISSLDATQLPDYGEKGVMVEDGCRQGPAPGRQTDPWFQPTGSVLTRCKTSPGRLLVNFFTLIINLPQTIAARDFSQKIGKNLGLEKLPGS